MINLEPGPMDMQEVAARTAWGEARSGGADAMHAVLNTGGNRLKHPSWMGKDLRSIFLMHAQYSTWIKDICTGSNYLAMMRVDVTDPLFHIAMELAGWLVDGSLPDITDGADSYYAAGTPVPTWAAKANFTKQVGPHLFFRTVRS
jgi:spore germination cell wall hydrolase CwlJ-like protein